MPEMLEQNGRFKWILSTARIAVILSIIVLALAAVAAVSGIVAYSIEAASTRHWLPVLPRILALGAILLVAFWMPTVYGAVRATIANESAVSQSAGRLERIETLLETHSHSLQRLTELGSLSDQAKSLIYRDREIEAMRETIRDDIMRHDYKTAEIMIQMMKDKFGYVEESERLGEELSSAKQATQEEQIDDAIARIQNVIDVHNWPKALRGAQRLRELFPNHTKIASLPDRVQKERTQHKRRLLQNYGEAVRRNDIDGSIALLKELDRHLTPQEAAALEESARGIFRAKLHSLGVQFALHVTDERWQDAIVAGEEIVRSFPNSRMSHEVRQKMPQLLARAEASVQVAGKD